MKNNYFEQTKWFPLVPTIREIKRVKCNSSLPITLRIDLTEKCNFNCPFCLYQSEASVIHKNINYKYPSHSQVSTQEELSKVIKLFVKKGIKSVILTGGGEPFMSNNFYAILDVLYKRKVEVGIITNGSKIDDYFIKNYVNNKYLKWIRVSLDSSTSKTWIAMHNPRDNTSFQDTISNIKLLADIKNRNFLVGINFLITPVNYHEILDAYKLVSGLGVDNIRYTPVFTKNGSQIYFKIKETIDELLREVAGKTKPLVKINFSRFEFINTPNHTKFCWFSNFSINLGVDLNLYPCCLKKYVKGMGTMISADNFNNDIQGYFAKMDKFRADTCKDCMYHEFNDFAENASMQSHLDNFIP